MPSTPVRHQMDRPNTGQYSFTNEWSMRKTSAMSFLTSISNRSKLFSIESQIHGVTRPDAFLLLVSYEFEITYI
ncbi:hypothetical protein P5673_031472 [Acropora cervicornis]|uniref:Uncharacterized protein n=1 Tax=Acropora cervicornis TaxID=6130 RepID=A0AAD9USJ3_ACRCE|nr:hypothetical protein P5673_031472 [Acropora cervicornis]